MNLFLKQNCDAVLFWVRSSVVYTNLIACRSRSARNRSQIRLLVLSPYPILVYELQSQCNSL